MDEEEYHQYLANGPNQRNAGDQTSQYEARKKARLEEMRRIGTPMESVDEMGTVVNAGSNKTNNKMGDYFRLPGAPSVKSGASKITSKSNEKQVGIRDIGHTEDLLQMKHDDILE